MPGSRTTLPHTALTLLLAAPLSCSPADEPGQVSDPQGCRTVILPADPAPDTSTSSTSSNTGTTNSSSSTTSTGIDSTSSDASTSSTTSASTRSTTEPVPYCGDSVVDEGEECDDGNDDNSDDCLDTCLGASCGDGFVHDGVEECDDGNDIATDACLTTCVAASCGDGFIQSGIEECDDSNTEDHDGCSSSCAIERLVFLRSTTVTGNLGGLAGADAKCQSLAEDAGLTNEGQTFRAWLSAGAKGPANDADRFPATVTTAQGPFLLPDDAHTKIADNWADLTDGSLAHPIDIDEKGKPVEPSTVWTNTTPQGAPAEKGDCSAWTESMVAIKAGMGLSYSVDADWTDSDMTNACPSASRFYCFQVTP